MKWSERIVWILLLAGVFFYFRNSVSYIQKTDTKIQPISQLVSSDTPKLVKVVDTVTKTKVRSKFIFVQKTIVDTHVVFKNVDTAAILKNYFSKSIYNDVVRSKYGSATIMDTISTNKIIGRSVLFNFNIPTTTITKVETPKKTTQLYVGPDIGFGIGGGLDLKLKSDHIASLDYLFTQHGGMLVISYKWKITIN